MSYWKKTDDAKGKEDSLQYGNHLAASSAIYCEWGGWKDVEGNDTHTNIYLSIYKNHNIIISTDHLLFYPYPFHLSNIFHVVFEDWI